MYDIEMKPTTHEREDEMSAHTPGPWKIMPGWYALYRKIVSDRHTEPMNILVSGGDGQDIDANARLIAAAPRMLEALELSLIEQERATLGLGWLDTPGIKMARAAILQAKGEAND
mgnify:FL=1